MYVTKRIKDIARIVKTHPDITAEQIRSRFRPVPDLRSINRTLQTMTDGELLSRARRGGDQNVNPFVYYPYNPRRGTDNFIHDNNVTAIALAIENKKPEGIEPLFYRRGLKKTFNGVSVNPDMGLTLRLLETMREKHFLMEYERSNSGKDGEAENGRDIEKALDFARLIVAGGLGCILENAQDGRQFWVYDDTPYEDAPERAEGFLKRTSEIGRKAPKTDVKSALASRRYFVTTYEEILADPYGNIFRTPADFDKTDPKTGKPFTYSFLYQSPVN